MFVKAASGNKDGPGAGVRENVVDLVQRLRRVDGNVNRAEAQDCEIGYRPFGAILGKQCDPISGTYAERRQTKGDVFDAFDESGGRDVMPLAVGPVIQGISFVMTQNSGKEQTGNGGRFPRG